MQIQKYEKRAGNNISEGTLKSRVSALNNFQTFLGDGKEPTVEDVEEWVDDLIEQFDRGEVKAGTIKQYFNSVRYYFEMIHGSSDELEHIRKWIPTGETDHGDYLDHQEWEKLMSVITNYRDRAFVQLMYEYARRPGEVLLLNRQDVNMDEETITFTILKKKKALRAKFTLRPESKEVIENLYKFSAEMEVPAEHDWEEGETVVPLFVSRNGRVSYDTMWRAIKGYTQKAGLEKNITPKSMRHTRATHLDWAGHSPAEIARHQLVHDPDTDVISAYIHDRDEEQVREPMTIDDE